MEVNATKRTDLFLIDPRNIVVMEGFNVRRDFDLEELKEQIKAKGVLNPVTVIPYKEDGVEKYKLVDGEKMIDVDKLITLLDSTNSLHSAMKEYKKTKQNENN